MYLDDVHHHIQSFPQGKRYFLQDQNVHSEKRAKISDQLFNTLLYTIIVCGPFSAHKARYKSSFPWYLLVTVTSYIGYSG